MKRKVVGVRISERKSKEHSSLINRLTRNNCLELFSLLEIKSADIKKVFVEPRPKTEHGYLIFERPSPDIAVLYLTHGWNLLIIETKTKKSSKSLLSADRELKRINDLFHKNGYSEIYNLLGCKIPLPVLESCRFQLAEVFGSANGQLQFYVRYRF